MSGFVPGTKIRVVSKAILTSSSSVVGRNGEFLCREAVVVWRAVGQTIFIQLLSGLKVLSWAFREPLNFLSGSVCCSSLLSPLRKRSLFLVIGLFLGLSHAHRISLCISLIMFYDAFLHRETIFDISTAENHIFPYRFLCDRNPCVLFYTIRDSWGPELLANCMDWCFP